MVTEGALTAEAVPDSFEAIEKAVVESKRGRWFLNEYVKRRCGADNQALITAIGKLASAANNNHELIAERLGKALGLITAIDGKLSPPPTTAKAAPAELKPEHMKFFKQDEELFESPAKSPVLAVAHKAPEPKPDTPKGAKLVINRQPDPMNEAAPMEPATEVTDLVAATTAEEASSSTSRIVIIRHKAGEMIGVPLHDELRAGA